MSAARLLGLVGALLVPAAGAAPWVVYETGFEPPEFLAGYALDGQGDWWLPWVAWPTDEIHTSWVADEYLGDIDAAWVRFDDPTLFGDSCLVFDDFKVSTDVGYPLPSRLEPVQVLEDGSFLVELLGEPGRACAVDASSDLAEWTALSTNTPGASASVVLDPGAVASPLRFYRARAIWP